MKVYCKNCRYRKSYVEMVGFSDVSFAEFYYCLKNSQFKDKIIDTPHGRKKVTHTCLYGEDFDKYNGKNNCKDYKRKWYKCWVKK